MHFKYISLPMLAAVAAAQSNTSLTDLVAQLPDCALGCFASSASTAGCATTNFTCLCTGTTSKTFLSTMEGCIFTSSCSSSDISNLTTLAPEICAEVADSPNATAVASASAEISSALASATASAKSSANNNFASVRGVGMGVVGAAVALAVFAM